MPSWPQTIYQRSSRKADALLDTTCFSSDSADFDFDSDTDSDADYIFVDLARPTTMPPKISDTSLNVKARYNHPTFLPPSFLTTLLQPERFKDYIQNELLSVPEKSRALITTTKESLRKEVNATAANTLLDSKEAVLLNIANLDWIIYTVFPDSSLPSKRFDDKALDDVEEFWDHSEQKFSNFPDSGGDTIRESEVQDWLNHLANVLAIKHGLIKPKPSSQNPSPLVSTSQAEEEDVYDEDGPDFDSELCGEAAKETSTGSAVESKDMLDSNSPGSVPAEEIAGVVVEDAEDRSYSMISHKKGPTGGYRLRKPDIILVDRVLRHKLHVGNLRPRWHHVEALVEVSISASRESMQKQIVEKAALMFESQPFRRFALGLAIRGCQTRVSKDRKDCKDGEDGKDGGDTQAEPEEATSNDQATEAQGATQPQARKTIEYCFFMIDRAGLCRIEWTECIGYQAITFARIVFALTFAHPEVLGVDTSMTLDNNGNVTKIRVQDKEGNRQFNVVKHIYSSLVLFGRGTHVFVVQDDDGNHHILKDAWLISENGLSEIEVLAQINKFLEEDPSDEAKTYRLMHSRFVAGEEIGDSTSTRRGRLQSTVLPPERVHRRVVTGPVGDPLTSFRSRQEFIKVLLDCVNWLDYLNNKCKFVHGDLSINNIVIHRAPLPRPPPQATTSTRPRVRTRSAVQKAQALVEPAPLSGLSENIPVTGVVIDYDYARVIGTVMHKASGTLPFMPIDSLNKHSCEKYIHQPCHDLESLFLTALGVILFTSGPCGQERPKDHVPVARWFNEIDREQLYKDKAFDLICYDLEIEPKIPLYWKPIAPYLYRLFRAVWPTGPTPSVKNMATHEKFKLILEEALEALKGHEEVPKNYAQVSQKRQRDFNDVGRYPYPHKISRGDGSANRLPRPASIKSHWKDPIG